MNILKRIVSRNVSVSSFSASEPEIQGPPGLLQHAIISQKATVEKLFFLKQNKMLRTIIYEVSLFWKGSADSS